jgi:hypothetical protein
MQLTLCGERLHAAQQQRRRSLITLFNVALRYPKEIV